MNVKDPSSRLMRWRNKIEEYQNELIYSKGKQNTNAVALSRVRYNEKNEINFMKRMDDDDFISEGSYTEKISESDSEIDPRENRKRSLKIIKLYSNKNMELKI